MVAVEGGQTVAATAVNISGPGSRTVLSIRPERVVVAPKEGECETVLQARVEELIYHGDHTRVRLDLPGSLGFIVKLPHARARAALETGDMVRIGWRGADCRALDARQGPTTGG
jgi:putative spermidine/putrescine transport system ATP-binding protein